MLSVRANRSTYGLLATAGVAPGMGGIGGTGGIGIPRYMSEPMVSCDVFRASLCWNDPPARSDMMATLSGRAFSPPNVCRSDAWGTIGMRGGLEGICSCIISCSLFLLISFLLSFLCGALLPDTDLSRDLLRLRKLNEPFRRRDPLLVLEDSARIGFVLS